MIAGVVVDSPLPHLDRPFDYAIPEALPWVTIGTRVRVPFAGRLVSGVVVSLHDGESAHVVKPVRSGGRLPSFSPEALSLARMIAERYAGSLWDVLRLMGPPRVAAVERLAWDEWAATPGTADALMRRPAGNTSHLVEAATTAGLPTTRGDRALWVATPRRPEVAPADALLGAALGTAAHGGTSIVIAPDARAMAALLRAAVAAGLSRWNSRVGGDIAVLDSDDGASVRYGSYLAAMRGLVPLVIGTRQAAWQPVPDLAGVVVWDEASSTLAEPRAPYPHARTVAAMRAQDSGAALLIAGHVVSAEALALVEHDFARRVESRPERSGLAAIEVIGAERREREGGAGRHWLPDREWPLLLAAAATGVAAVVVPQAGYASGLACVRCGTPAECPECSGDLSRSAATAVAKCSDCGVEAPDWHCPECREHRTRPVGLGVDRLAAQVTRMAPGVNVVQSSSTVGVIPDLTVDHGIVVATPGALPAVVHGYGHVTVVGARVSITDGLGSEAQSLRRWLNAAALVAPRQDGGRMSVVGELPEEIRQALVSWDGASVAARDLAQRVTLGLPPHRRALRIDGPPDAIDEAAHAVGGMTADLLRDADGAFVLASRGTMPAVTSALRGVVVSRSARSGTPLYVRVDATPGG